MCKFRLFGRQVLEVFCFGAVEKYIKLLSVKRLKPVPKPQPANPDHEGWITPKVYKGLSMHEQELLDEKHE
jgi:hypothetical protein